MAKRKKHTPSIINQILHYMIWVLIALAVVLSSLVTGYYFGYEDAKDEVLTKEKIKQKNKIKLINQLEKVSVNTKKPNVNKRLQEVLKKETKEYTSASHEFDNTTLKEPENIKREIKHSSSKPKLAIIIDDVSTARHIRAVKSLSLPITMSFLPPSAARPNSAKLAAKEKVYMVHLPMEAKNYNAEEPITLRVNDSQRVISQRIRELKRLFPKVEYINNHTGSTFTANETSMFKLINALNKEHIHFIDSRTTADTKAPKVLESFNQEYVSRDVFLDHENNKEYIMKQIKKAVEVAKDHGTAIAIGHPHKNTIEALREAKNAFKDVELVYINKLH